MNMVDSIHEVLNSNPNFSAELKNNIFELIVLFSTKFPNVKLDSLKNRIGNLQIKKLNKFLNNDVSYYDNRTNTIYINSSKLNDGYDGKYVLMFNLLNVIASNNTQIGFDQDGKFEALNTGYTEIVTNYLVGNEGEKLLYPEAMVETNMLTVMIGSDTLENAYFNNDTNLLITGFQKAGIEI